MGGGWGGGLAIARECAGMRSRSSLRAMSFQLITLNIIIKCFHF